MCHTISVSPTEQYSQLLATREAKLAQLDTLHARLGSIRLLIGASFLIIAWFCFGARTIASWWLLAPIAAFIAAVAFHQRARAAGSRARRAVQFYRAGLDRIHDQWSGRGTTGERFKVAHHVYGDDLDLFGPGSLYELLCAARTQMGENVLAQWLLTPGALGTIRERQVCIAELRDLLSLRESLAVEGDVSKIDLHPQMLEDWARAPNRLHRTWIRAAATPLVMLTAAAAFVWAVWGVRFPLLALIIVEIGIGYALRLPIQAAIAGVESAFEDLKSLSALLHGIESQVFESVPLRALQTRLSSHTMSASKALSKLSTVVNFVEARRNPLLAPFMVLLLYPLHTALAAERWRAAHGAVIHAWLGALGEFEALLSLAQYAYEHPEHQNPEFIAGAPCFRAAQLGHPLIARASCVCNDVEISSPTRVLLVSGSNMSGKSTLLRTVGINTVLAMAGAPVRATSLQLTPLQLGASIRINDSLHEGSSRFYAEITRLRQLFEPAELPLLFLLDELLQGTNSADRKVGAQGLIRALIKRGAIGLISTHDLALAEIADVEADSIKNVHFQDELLQGKLKFDFKLRPGIVTKSNGIELMRSIGLDV